MVHFCVTYIFNVFHILHKSYNHNNDNNNDDDNNNNNNNNNNGAKHLRNWVDFRCLL